MCGAGILSAAPVLTGAAEVGDGNGNGILQAEKCRLEKCGFRLVGRPKDINQGWERRAGAGAGAGACAGAGMYSCGLVMTVL